MNDWDPVTRARRAVEPFGLELRDGEVIRHTGSVLVRGRSEGVLVRLDPTDAGPAAHRQVAVATMLAHLGVPAARIAAALSGPAPRLVDGWWVTVWELLDVLDVQVPAADLGRLARRLHRASAGLDASEVTTLPKLDPFAGIDAQLATSIDDPDATLLAGVRAELRSEWDALSPDPLGDALVHGDLHGDNVVATASGPTLVDFELSGWGGATYDLAARVVVHRRYGGSAAELESFVATYGPPAETAVGWPGLEVLTRTFALWTTSWAVANRHRSPRHATEADLRVGWWREGAPVDPTPTWTVL